jgi:pimeloyl-ACP methyl ester carboxylesterase
MEWGEEQNPNVLICMHGLMRNAYDFEELASALSKDYRVLAVDVVGRGQSDWLQNYQNYNYGTYVSDLLTLCFSLNLTQVDWVGTSMGGLIGMMIASLPNSPIRKLVMNDIGAYVPQAALHRIATYISKKAPHFADLHAAELYFREVYQPFGELSAAQWQHIAKHSVRSIPEGGLTLIYDPNIPKAFIPEGQTAETIQAVELWELWKNVQCPTLILHGAESDLLLPETLARMQQTRANVHSITVPKVGHAPSLMIPEQITWIRDWLLSA